LWSIIEAPSYGWTDSTILMGFAVGTVILAAFLAWELHTSTPMLDLNFFKNPRFSAASGAITITFFALFGTLFLLTQYLQLVLAFSTVEAGAVLLPQAATIMVAAPLSSMWVRKFGNKRVVFVGLLIVALSYAMLTRLDVNSTALQVIIVTMVMGLGMGNVMAPCTDSIMGSLPRAKAGVGSAVNDTTRQFGGALGVAVYGSVLASRYADHVASRLGGIVSGSLLADVKDSVGSALNATQKPAGQPFASQIIDASRRSFVDGMHTAVLLAMVVLLVAAAIVVRFLPARATEGEHPLDVVPVGIAPVDVTTADVAADLAEAIEHA
jgi:Na+/melibiose symporter-like transporter